MRRVLALTALLPGLCGCYAEQPAPYYGYGAPGYQQPGYPPPGYPPAGYAPAPYDPYADAYPGYSYNDGNPTFIDGGIAMPLVIYGGEWGYWDHEHHWRRAPEGVSRNLQQRQTGGFRPGAPPPGGFGQRGAPPPAGFEQHGGPPPGRQPEPMRPMGGPPPGRPPQAFQPAAAPPPQRQAPTPERQSGHRCEPGQRC